MPETYPLADIPAAVIDMLRDEANLSTARHVLDDARRDCLTRQETAQSQRPALGFLAGKKQREEYNTAISAVTGQLNMIDGMLGRVSVARDRLQPALRAAMVGYLTESDPVYRHGLRAGRYNEQWVRIHGMITDRLTAFLRDAREIRNAIDTDVKGGRSRHSGDAAWRLANARVAAAELEKAIEDLNKAAFDHAASIVDTPFSEVRLPTLEPWPCIERIDTITARPPAEALGEVDRMIAEFVEYKEPSINTLAGMYNASAGEHAQVAERRIRERWNELLLHAEAHLVADAELEPTLAAIERRQAEAERARLVAQIPNKPFSAER